MDAMIEGRSVSARVEPTKEQAEEAVRILIRWAGDDPGREGLKDTPRRVVDAYGELFSGYSGSSGDLTARTFSDIGGYEDMVVIKDIAFFSHCEHHMLPFKGYAHIGYMPDGRVLGLSKFARIVELFARRLQTQEAMTAQIAHFLVTGIRPKGLAVMLEAEHMCMSMRGIQKEGSLTRTATFKGSMEVCAHLQSRFMSAIRT